MTDHARIFCVTLIAACISLAVILATVAIATNN